MIALAIAVIQVIILCILGKYLTAAVPFLGLAVWKIQAYYLKTSRQLRLLDIEAKAPLYTHFLETTDGISSVRAFGWVSQFRQRNVEKLNRSQKPMYMLLCIQQWLQVVLDVLVGIMAVIIVATITSLKDQFSAATIGVSLNLILTFNGTLARTIKYWTMTETSVGAVSRVRNFVLDTPREDQSGETPPEGSWPKSGAVEFKDLTAGYE